MYKPFDERTEMIDVHYWWHVEHRYNYWAVDRYMYPKEFADVTDDLYDGKIAKHLCSTWFRHDSGPVFTGTKKAAKKVAWLLNEAYRTGDSGARRSY